MSVLVKGMKIPENCEMCAIKVWDYSWEDEGYVCPISGVKTLSIGRQDACPLVEVPTPHRRLIDERHVQWAFNYAILDEAKKTGTCRATWNEVYSIIKTVPTVIEAEGGEE